MPRAKEITLAIAGFGACGRAFARILAAKRRELATQRGLAFHLTGIATRSHGLAIDPAGIDMRKAIRRVESGQCLDSLHVGPPIPDTLTFIRHRPSQILFEMTTLEPMTGQPALDHVRTALKLGIHVITANKGPVAVAYRRLARLAKTQGCAFRFEGTVMDGTPVFNWVEKTLPGARVTGFHGILNSTSNYILTEMEKGRSFEAALKGAQAMGIAEADAGYDIDGWDAAAKTAALANVLLGANTRPSEIKRRGIRNLGRKDLAAARRKGKALRLIARGARKGRTLTVRVAPELLNQTDPMAHVTGTSSVLAIQTDLMKELMVIEKDGGIEQTAYALYSDLLTVVDRYFAN
jgi:homoserine dehydrogenase